MPSAQKPGAVRCTYVDCGHYFRTEKEMRRHKVIEHTICTRCDEDFPNEESLLLHKIKSERHIVCPLCGQDFGSEGGRDLHVRTIHPRFQEIKCPWEACGRVFTNASHYISHIEKGACQGGVTEQTLLQRRVLKEMEWKERDRLESTEPMPAQIGASTIDTQSQGGVPVDSTEWKDREALAHQPWSEERKKHRDHDKAYSNASEMSARHWPTLADSKHLNQKQSPLANNQVRSTHRAGVQSSPDGPFPEISRRLEGKEALKAYREYNPNWNPNMYLNLRSGKFECCNRQFDNVEKLAEHMIEHVARRFRCPRCLKEFKSTAALISHCEMSQKCHVFRVENHEQVVDRVSGGFLQSSQKEGGSSLALHPGDLREKPAYGGMANLERGYATRW